MKILLVGAAADWSISDVGFGYRDALTSLGHEVRFWNLSRRIEFWSVSMHNWTAAHNLPEPDLAATFRECCDCILPEAYRYQPDLILITSAMGFHPDALILLKDFKVGLILTESPYDDDKHEAIIRLVDYVFVNDRDSATKFSALHPRVLYLPTAYNHKLHTNDLSPTGLDHPMCDVLFVGTGFPERQRFLEAVDWQRLSIDFQLYGFWNWSDVDGTAPPPSPVLQHIAQPPITNDETARRYSGADIVLNFYRDGAGYSMNPRSYEIAAVGAFQLAQDSSLEAHELLGDTIDYFTTPADLADKIAFWLDPANDRLRRIKAQLAHDLVVPVHSYLNRARDLITFTGLDVSPPVSGSASSPVSWGVPFNKRD